MKVEGPIMNAKGAKVQQEPFLQPWGPKELVRGHHCNGVTASGTLEQVCSSPPEPSHHLKWLQGFQNATRCEGNPSTQIVQIKHLNSYRTVVYFLHKLCIVEKQSSRDYCLWGTYAHRAFHLCADIGCTEMALCADDASGT